MFKSKSFSDFFPIPLHSLLPRPQLLLPTALNIPTTTSPNIVFTTTISNLQANAIIEPHIRKNFIDTWIFSNNNKYDINRNI